MERSLNIMKQKVVRSEDRNRVDVQRKVSENASLISYVGKGKHNVDLFCIQRTELLEEAL